MAYVYLCFELFYFDFLFFRVEHLFVIYDHHHFSMVVILTRSWIWT
jgi:hypothetical protein